MRVNTLVHCSGTAVVGAALRYLQYDHLLVSLAKHTVIRGHASSGQGHKRALYSGNDTYAPPTLPGADWSAAD